MEYEILVGDCLQRLLSIPDNSIHCVVTSPPYYGLRDYGVDGQIGLEATPQDFLQKMVAVFREVRRVLRPDGTCWVNMGDSYCSTAPGTMGDKLNQRGILSGVSDRRAEGSRKPRPLTPEGMKPKDLMGMPWRLAFALQEDGWWLRQDIIWAKPNGMPGSQLDRCTSSHEYVFMLTKSANYWSDFDAIKTPTRESSLIRTAQDVQAQAGSHRANGGAKSNGSMKPVGGDKQRGHSRRHAGFNERWDAMDKSEQQSMPAMMRDVWFIPPAQFAEAHFAVMPHELARRCIAAGCPEGGTVLDPFNGSGTTGLVAISMRCNYIGIELNPEYAAMTERRLQAATSQGVLI
jgi:DNA modification methylase